MINRRRRFGQSPQARVIQPPAGWENRYSYRQFASEIDGSDQLLSNLANNPSVRSSVAWVDTELHCLVQDVTASRLAEMDTVITKAAAISMPFYPAFRFLAGGTGMVVAPTATDWCKRSYWETIVTTKLPDLLARRPAGEPRLGIDSEAYGGDELNRISLAARGETMDRFRSAIEPLIDLFINSNPRVIPCIYAQVLGSLDHFNILAECLMNALGPEYMELWWETAFSLPEAYRISKWDNYQFLAAKCHVEKSNWEKNYQELYGQFRAPVRHRFAMDDDGTQYVWGNKFRAEVPNTYGPIKPWIFDGTRSNKTSWGTPNGFNGVGLKSANDADYVMNWLPTNANNQVGILTTDGQAAVPLATNFAQGAANSVAFSYGNVLTHNVLGLVLAEPQVGNIWGGVRFEGMLPTVAATPWMIDFSCDLWPSVSVDAPIISSYQYNQQSWQVYRKNSDGRLYLQIKKTSTTYDEFALSANTFAAGASVRMQIGRSGNIWLYSEGSEAINRTDVGYSVPVTNIGLLTLGMGCTPANFPLDNDQFSVPGILLPSTRHPVSTRDDSQLHVWKSRLLSDSEITTQVRGNFWPFGRYT